MGKAFGNKKAENKRPINCKGDNYSTPYSLTEMLFEKESFDFSKSVLEPAAGEGTMAEVLKKKFEKVVSFDPIKGYYDFCNNHLYCEDHKLKNYSFLFHVFSTYSYIITNPPYSLADQFVLRAKELEPEKFCFLLRTNFLSGQSRLKKGIYEGLKKVLIFNRMPDLRAPIRPDGKFPTAMIVYAWFVWEKGYQGKPEIDWLDCSRYVLHVNKRERGK